MELRLERASSLMDLRRIQRRVAALLMSDKHVELQKFPLRKRTLPRTVCYVCSRIDPNGIFRKPNDHLYKRGFFHSCEYLQNATHTKEELIKQDSADFETKLEVNRIETELTGNRYETEELAGNRTETISVTIRRGSRSTKFPSPIKREGTLGSDTSKFGYAKRSPKERFLHTETSDLTSSKYSLPSIVPEKRSHLSEVSLPKKLQNSDAFRTTSVALTRLSGKSPFLSETLVAGSETEEVSIGERITIIPTGLDRTSAISGLSTFSEGTTPSKSTNDLDSKFASDEGRTLPSKHSFATIPSRRSVTSPAERRSITTITAKDKISPSTSDRSAVIDVSHDQSHGLQIPQPLVREVVMIGECREPEKRPKAGHQRERLFRSRQIMTPGRSESGFRVDNDHFTDPGSGISQRYSDHINEQAKFDLGSFSDSCSSKNFSEEASIVFSDKTAESHYHANRLSFCRCNTGQRELTHSRNLCKTCGKVNQVGDSTNRDLGSEQTHNQTESVTRASSSNRCLSTRQQMLRHDETKMNRRSETTIDDESLNRMKLRSKTTIDDDYIARMYMRSKPSTDDEYVTRMNIRSKQATDEDYMDLDSIIHEDDGRYWSSGEESCSPLSWHRYNHANPYPLVNPDIHKVVYIKALQAARAKGKKKLEDFGELIRRPNVFSYIPLLPDKRQTYGKYLGLKPDDSAKPKKGQLMKHIFGDFRPEDFYKGSKAKNKAEVILDYSSNDSSTDKITSVESPITAV